MIAALLVSLVGCGGTQGDQGEAGPQGEQGEQGPQGEGGPQGEMGPPGTTTGLVFLGTSDDYLALGTSEDFDFGTIAGADAATGTTVMGTGSTHAAGFSTAVESAGTYEGSLRGVWAASMNTEGIVVELQLSCTGAPTVHANPVRLSLAVAGGSNVQSNTPFETITWISAEAGDTITCALQKNVLDVSEDGNDILFHNVHEPIVVTLTLVAPE